MKVTLTKKHHGHDEEMKTSVKIWLH